MHRTSTKLTAVSVAVATLLFTQQVLAQQAAPPPDGGASGWRKVGDAAANGQPSAPAAYPPQAYPQQPYPQQQPPYAQQQQPPYTQQQPAPPQGYPQPTPPQAPRAAVPAFLHVPAGTFVTVRTQQLLSSDANHPGDAFSATVAQPLVIDGVVVAEPGQTVSGQVIEAERAGRVQGTARLRIQLTELTLVDGQQLPIRTQFIGRRAATSVGRDAGAIAGTTGFGAALGAAAGWGTGAAIGAGAGAAVGVLGVLLTRGHPSIIYPEETLTFRLEAPLTVDTQRSTQAFRYVQPNEYNQPLLTQQTPAPPAPYAPPPVPAVPAPVYYPYPYYAAYPYYYGPSFSFFYGRGGFYGPGYYHRGYYGGYRR